MFKNILSKWCKNEAERFANKSTLSIQDPVRRDHQVGKYCLISAVLYFIAGDHYEAKRYREMWQYLHRVKE